mgnify:CR=1 FL=1
MKQGKKGTARAYPRTSAWRCACPVIAGAPREQLSLQGEHMKFDAFDLNKDILAAVAVQGYHTPTPIQEKAIPLSLIHISEPTRPY